MEKIASILQVFSLTVTDAYMILVGMVLFTALWKALDSILFTPYLKLLELRDQATVGVLEDADIYNKQADELRAKREAQLTAARQEAFAERLGIVNEAKAEAQKIIDATQSKTESLTREKREEITKQLSSARSGGAGEIDALADVAIERIHSALN